MGWGMTRVATSVDEARERMNLDSDELCYPRHWSTEEPEYSIKRWHLVATSDFMFYNIRTDKVGPGRTVFGVEGCMSDVKTSREPEWPAPPGFALP